MTPRTYDSPAAFKEALERRLRTRTPEGQIVARTRQLLVFDRFLARIATVFGDAATLKGGLALELRVDRARTTKDIDLRVLGSSADLLARLQQAVRLDLGDFLSFEIAADAAQPEIEGDGMKYANMLVKQYLLLEQVDEDELSPRLLARFQSDVDDSQAEIEASGGDSRSWVTARMSPHET